VWYFSGSAELTLPLHVVFCYFLMRGEMARSLLQCVHGRGTHKTILYSAGVVVMAAAILTAVGCYETYVEVIDVSSAVAVTGALGHYTYDAGGEVTISAVPGSNDYRFREVSKDNEVSTGYIRMVPLQGDIYIVQAKYDDDEVYYLAFYQFTSDRHFKPMEPHVDDKKLDQLAQQYGVTIDWDFDLVPYLNGSRSTIMAFLLGHASLPFSSDK
jgi:hypothetical protein